MLSLRDCFAFSELTERGPGHRRTRAHPGDRRRRARQRPGPLEDGVLMIKANMLTASSTRAATAISTARMRSTPATAGSTPCTRRHDALAFPRAPSRRARAARRAARRSSLPGRARSAGTSSPRACPPESSSRRPRRHRARRARSGSRARSPASFMSLRRRVAQVLRHRPRLVFGDETRAPNYTPRTPRCFRRAGQVDHRLGERELAFRAAQPLVGLAGVERERSARGSASPMSSIAMRTIRRPR